VSGPVPPDNCRLTLCITVVDPLPHILWALQLGQDEIAQPTSATKRRISFDFTVEREA
jgi:hypothetical protein